MSIENFDTDSRPWLPPLLRALSYPPLALLYWIADGLFVVLFYLLRFERNLVIENLRRAFPERQPADIDHLAATSYRHAVQVLFETIKAQRLSRRELLQHVHIVNPQQVDDLLRRHKSVICVAAHQGNWEWLQLACSAQLKAPLAALYKPVRYPVVDSLLIKMRSRFGTQLIAAQSSLPELLNFSRQPGVIALVADQGPRPEEDKYWSRFLGQDTAFFPGLEKLARLLRAPVVFVHMQRIRRSRYRIRFEILTEPPYEKKEGSIMEAYIQAVEKQVREAPQDWLWFYKRWKYKRSVYD